MIDRASSRLPVVRPLTAARRARILSAVALGFVLFTAALWARAGAAPETLVQGGVSAAAGQCTAGPYAGVLVYDVPDLPPAVKAKAKAKANSARPALPDPQLLAEAMDAPRRIVLATRAQGGWHQQTIATTARIDGPVCPRETTPAPVLAWTARVCQEWRLCLWRDGTVKILARSPQLLRNPVVAWCAEGPVAGCERDAGSGAVITLYNEAGKTLMETPGRHGRLVAGADGLLLLAERATRDAIWLELTRLRAGRPQPPIRIQGPRDYTFNADLALDRGTGAALIAAESAVAFGEGCQLGLDRELRAWRLDPNSLLAVPCPESSGGLIPVVQRAFKTEMGGSVENTPPIRPRVVWTPAGPRVAFREFRCRVKKDFGWDVWWSRLEGGSWTAPARLTEQLGSPDTGYNIIADGDHFLGVFPELDNPGNSNRSSAFRVALRAFVSGQDLGVTELPGPQRGGAWRTPGRVVEIAPEPPPLPESPSGLSLVWGDLHTHSCYSKCVGAANGMPDEMLRYQRDVLGLDVIGLLEHTSMMAPAEDLWVCDRQEAEAGDGRIVLYGTEPGVSPGRHTNIYATSRATFDRLCASFVNKASDRAAAYRACLAAAPEGQVVALRHFHGDTATDDRGAAQTFEPRLELAMEAMQGRTNALLGEGSKAGFPAVYLNQGFKIGLVGGSDHFRETEAVNHYCLTGFWVKERSAAGVWEALRARRTVAVSDAKVALWVECDGAVMGKDAEAGASEGVRFRVSVASARPVKSVTLIRDGEVLPWTEVGRGAATIELRDNPAPGRHWYVVTAQAESAYPGKLAVAHASPVFVTVK